ncbi:TetR/AcrR family transcriptional regulator [Actinoplanes sp. Pm04-4]|uniref:TetR/AcrR family transcriptional regulator n=1 Tax=Paractinoplanes pyxinae TaxID=2997416 RepID=A0ABT4B129_9ACTN|nr:TetR/AcrR family transcriptional regulator [Actinoplanes pyxinae]MCY1140196.1 TetR/AcrR family transcriptional regulator [Actinoplanes pyxinae]
MTAAAARRADVRSRIVTLAAQMLREEGPAAVTTRGVAERAGMQAPIIYRLFGDKDGLLDAVAEHVMAGQVAAKTEATPADSDPLQDLHATWLAQIEFGVNHPALFRLLSDPDRVRQSAAARAGREALGAQVSRIAAAGRLRLSEQRAVAVIQAAAVGTIQTLLATPPELTDPALPATMWDAVLSQILTDAPPATSQDTVAATVTFRAHVPRLDALTPSERQLLTDWLDRVLTHNPQPAD